VGEDGQEGPCLHHHGERFAAKGDTPNVEALEGADKEREDQQAVCSQAKKKAEPISRLDLLMHPASLGQEPK